MAFFRKVCHGFDSPMTAKSFPTKRLSDGNVRAPVNSIFGFCLGVAIFLTTGFLPVKGDSVTALEFDGMDDLVEIPSKPILGNTFTEEAWILPSPKDDRYHGIVGYPSTNVNFRAPGIWIVRQTCLHAGFGDGKNWMAFSSEPNAIELNVWNHVAATYDGNVYRLYANGTEVGSLTVRKTPLRQHVSRIGRVDYWFPGAIREVRLWNRALTSEEIRAQMMKKMTGAERGLVAYFPLDDGDGLEAKNAVPDGKNGKLMYGPRWITSTAPVAAKALKNQAMASGPGSVEHFLPNGDNVAPDAPVEIVLHKAAEKVELSGIRLSFDKALVEPTITTNEMGSLLLHYETGKLLEAGSPHTVDLSYVVTGKPETNEFSYNFSISTSVILSR